MIAIASSEGFFLHDCTEEQFDQELAQRKYKNMPSDYLVGWLFLNSSSIDLIRKIGIETAYFSAVGIINNYKKMRMDEYLTALNKNIDVPVIQYQKKRT